MELPIGWTARPATNQDAAAIYELVAAAELDLDGQVELDPDDIIAHLARPTLDLQRDTVLLHDPAGRLAASAELYRGVRASVDVHPEFRGHGLGQWLLGWTEERARAMDSDRVGQTVTDNNRFAVDLFGRNGYQPKDTAWILEILLTQPPQPRPAPPELTVRQFTPGRDEHAAYELIEAAFGEWPDRLPVGFEEWFQVVAGRDTFAPALSYLALDGDRVVGAVLSFDYPDSAEGYVHQVAVDKAYRNRGVARALLGQTFAGFHRLGRRSVALSTNSYTGALTLYQNVGMQIRRSYTNYEKRLTG